MEKKIEEIEELNKIKNREKREEILKKLNIKLNNHNNIIDKLMKNKDCNSDNQLLVKELINLNGFLIIFNKLFRKLDNKLEIINITYNLNENGNIIVQNSDKEIFYENSESYGEFYLFSNDQNYTIINKSDNKPINNFKEERKSIIFNSLEFSAEYEKDLEQYYFNNDKENITLIFGDEYTLDKFYIYLSEYKKEMKRMGECFSSILNKQDLISACRLDKANRKYINNFSNLCNVKFSDGERCEKINESLRKIKKNLEQINRDYNYISDKFIEIFNNLEIDTRYKEKILKNDYELKQLPNKISPINEIMDFSQIQENNLLSIPIINVDSLSGDIFCSYNQLDININSFDSSLFSEPYKIQILTISNYSLLINIKEVEQYIQKKGYIIDSVENYVRVNDLVDNNKPIEIKVKIPKIEDNSIEKEIHLLKFNLEIRCQNNDNNKKFSIKPFRLPISIRMNLVPIILKIITNNKKLKIDHNNFLIDNKLYKGEKIILYLKEIQSNIQTKLKPLIQLEGKKDNNSTKPKISLTNEKESFKLCVTMPNNGKGKYGMKANINIFYTQFIKFTININSDLLDFSYNVKLFDLNSKIFLNDKLYLKYNYLEKIKQKKILKIYLKYIFEEGITEKFIGEIYFKNENENFIKNNKIVELKLEIDKNIFNKNKSPNILIKSKINEVIKEANIIFINEENDNNLDIFEKYDIKEEIDNEEDNEKNDIYYFVEDKGISSDINLNDDKNKDNNDENFIEKEREFNSVKIELSDLIEPKSPFSLKDIDDFYSSCIKIIRTLPSYLMYSLKIKSQENIIKAEKIFNKLFTYYNIYPLNKKNNSFLNEKINAFIKSYKDLAKRLYKSKLKSKKSNILDLLGINEFELLDDNIQTEYIVQPKQINLDIPEIKNEQFFSIKDISKEIIPESYFTERIRRRNLSKYETGNFFSTKNNELASFNEKNDYFNIKNLFKGKKDEAEKGEKSSDYTYENERNTIAINSLEKINLGNREYIDRLKDEENQINNNNEKEKDSDQNKIGYEIIEEKTKILQMKQETFQNYNFTEKNGIHWILKKIDKLEANTELNLTKIKGYLPINLFTDLNNKKIQYKIFELSDHILQLSSIAFNEISKLIGPDTKMDIPFSKMCAILLIDGSCYISYKRKIINFYILCSYSTLFNLLEIPYGIAVIADGKFKIILKQFEEPHSFDILEKVYESLMIRRFRDNLANSQKFAKETFMFSVKYNLKEENNEIPKFYKEHPKKIIITITDGLDEELKLTHKWNNLIFNDDDISFGFIFNKPDFPNNEDKKKIEKLWENFIEESKKAKSKVIVLIFDRIQKNNFYDNLAIFIRDLVCQKHENFEENIIKPIYKPNFLEENINLNFIPILNEKLFKSKKNSNAENQLYIQNYPLLSSSDGIFNEEIELPEKNKLGQICKGIVDKNIQQKFKNFIDNFIIKYNEIDKMSLGKIFKKNKGSQKVLSTTGSEIDIISLVISILNREPRPKIFLEEIGEMKRQYAVSIIIDNSLSCFGDISRDHSFSILRELLSPLSYLDISKFDLILTTDKSPIILCSDLSSQKCLKNDSSLWIGLFKYLQEPYYGCDLSSAINFIYNLNRERNEYSKRIFVLTDGLYERNEQIYIKKQIQNCTQLDMNIIGIGIGSYPIGIENIFEKIIYTVEPSNLLLGLSGFFEQIHITTKEKMIGFEQRYNKQELKDLIKKIISNDRVYFTKLNEELRKIEVNYTTFEYFKKPVILSEHFSNLNEAVNPEESENTLMLEKNFLLGKKILIVMLWSYDLNKSNENKLINPGNLFRSKKVNVYTNNIDEKNEGEPCVESAVDIYGLKIYVVLDYENAIKELTKNVDGRYDYNSVWIMCGPQKAILPNPKSDPNLIGEFMKVINIFWKNGGSLVFFADGDPLYYQVNLFLENAEFPLDDSDIENYDLEIQKIVQINDENENDNNNFENDKNEINLPEEEQEKQKTEEEEEIKENKEEKIEENKNNKYSINDNHENEEEEIKEEKNEIIEDKSEDNEDNNKEQEEEEEEEIKEGKDEIIEEEDDNNHDKNLKVEEEEINENSIRNPEIEEKIDLKILKANFRIRGSHKGRETLTRDEEGLLDKNKTFNGSNYVASNVKRPNIGANLNKIYEGVTISYAQEEEDDIYSIFDKLGVSRISAKKRYSDFLRKRNKNPIYPFIPFAKDSEGGISIMIYYGRQCGDVVIDCGFTKCFIEMEEEGTFRYIRNLSAVTSRCDVLMKEGEDPQVWKPDYIDYKLDLSKNYFWKDFKRKIFIIEFDKPISMETKLYIYEEIIKELYSEYNNKIYFYSNGIKEIKLEDIIKENSLIPEKNFQNNLEELAQNLLDECNERFGNNYSIEIFSDGYCEDQDNKFIDFILSNDNINFDRLSYQLPPGIEVNVTPDITLQTLSNISKIKTYEELKANYRNIRNCLIFLPYQYLPNLAELNIPQELKNMAKKIIGKIENEDIKNLEIKRFSVLLFYATSQIEDVGFNKAA